MKDISQTVASDIMHGPVVCARPDDTLKEFEDKIDDRHISGMPVVEGGKMIGIITTDDLVSVAAAMDAMARYVAGAMQSDGPVNTAPDSDGDGVPDNLSFRGQIPNMTVREAMARSVVTCSPTTPLEDVIRQMVQHHIHRIVVAEDDQPVGIISTLDVLSALLA